MFVRCAYFKGTVAPQHRERFASIVRERIAPAMPPFPKIRRLEYHWGRESEADRRGIYLVIEHAYDSLEDIATAITCDIRQNMQGDIDVASALFDGWVYHVNHEAESVEVN